MNSIIRKTIITSTAAFAAFALAGVAMASTVWLGSSSLDGQYAKAHKDDSSFTTKDLQCASGSYVSSVSLRNGSWGTYGSVDRVEIECERMSGGSSGTKTAGFSDAPSPNLTSLWTEECSGDAGQRYMDGLEVAYDNYVKDFRVHCGTEEEDSHGDWSIVTSEYSGWVVNGTTTDSDDDMEDLRCNTGKIMAGIRIRYRSDADEIAVTRVQLYCATVTYD